MTAKSQTELEQEAGRKAVARRARPIAPETVITTSLDGAAANAGPAGSIGASATHIPGPTGAAAMMATLTRIDKSGVEAFIRARMAEEGLPGDAPTTEPPPPHASTVDEEPESGGDTSHTKPSGLTAAEIALLDSQLPDIGGAIRGKPVTPDGDGWRVGSSTKISKNGRWFDFKAQQGGFGAASFIAHYRACTPEEAVAWAQSWLAQHPQRGPCGGADEDDGAGEDSADTLQRRAYIESTYAARLPIAGTPAAAYLVGRGLDPAQLRPEIVERMGWLPNHRGAEGALVFPYTDEAGGLQGLHFVFVTPTGEKSPHEPARQTRRGPPDWRTNGRALLRLDFGTGPEMVVAEGFENALAISLAGADRVVAVGAVGAYGRCRLPRTVETIMIAHDGDDPDAKPAAAQAYHRGVVRYLGQGLMLRMTAPPTGCDPNDVLKRGGPDALKKLLTEARCDLGKFDDAAFLDEVCGSTISPTIAPARRP